MQKFFFDFFPILLFFAVFKFSGIYAATGAAMAATGFQVLWAWVKYRKVGFTLWVNFFLIALLGGTTLLFQNDVFVKWKPTALYWLFSAALLGGPLFFKKNLIRLLVSDKIDLPDIAWSRLNYYWAFCFLLMGFANLAVAFLFGFSTDAWVNFKLFGGLGLMILFALLQGFVLSKYLPKE